MAPRSWEVSQCSSSKKSPVKRENLCNLLSKTIHKKKLNKVKRSPDFRIDALLRSTVKKLYTRVLEEELASRTPKKESVNVEKPNNYSRWDIENKPVKQSKSDCGLPSTVTNDHMCIENDQNNNHQKNNPDSKLEKSWGSVNGNWSDKTCDEDPFGVSQFLQNVKKWCR